MGTSTQYLLLTTCDLQHTTYYLLLTTHSLLITIWWPQLYWDGYELIGWLHWDLGARCEGVCVCVCACVCACVSACVGAYVRVYVGVGMGVGVGVGVRSMTTCSRCGGTCSACSPSHRLPPHLPSPLQRSGVVRPAALPASDHPSIRPLVWPVWMEGAAQGRCACCHGYRPPPARCCVEGVQGRENRIRRAVSGE